MKGVAETVKNLALVGCGDGVEGRGDRPFAGNGQNTG
ncbi:MAG: hypothetical protein QOF33_3533, partial [Thermomicrobiales bacterium]|nr:hypothetical protein [Thermomicrobiales bacterium]